MAIVVLFRLNGGRREEKERDRQDFAATGLLLKVEKTGDNRETPCGTL
jgi:hypothetical protein